MVPAYFTRLFAEINDVRDSARAELGSIAVHLLRMALSESGNKSQMPSVRETLRFQIQEFVQQNLANVELSVDTVATRFRCSKRHIHAVFSEQGTTLGQFIWRSRLARIRDALGDSRLLHRSVTDIAYQWGFNNAAHFSRAFKAQYGMPPTRYRAEALLHGTSVR